MSWPASLVVMATRSGSTAKWTKARRAQGDVRRVPVRAVLRDGVLDVLVRQRVLQLRRRRRDAVDEQRQVEGLVRVGLVREAGG